MQLSNRKLWLVGAIVAGVVIILTLLTAPTQDVNNYGSTYSRMPDGYGAWYRYMEKRGTPLKRLQKSWEFLTAQDEASLTLLRVIPRLTERQNVDSKLKKWVEKGNTLVLLGVKEIATPAPFSSSVKTEIGQIEIETSRRRQDVEKNRIILGDRFGAIIWTEPIGKGRIIYSTTPYLGANAYQDYLSNYQFLAELVTEAEATIWIDEYIHGYRDRESIQGETEGTVWSYLSKTPLLLLFIQGIILVGLAIGAGNQRLGRATPLTSPKINNSEAYIQGLASVLQKAERNDFVVSIISQAQKQELQKILGLNDTPLTAKNFIQLVGQNPKMAKELKSLLATPSRSRPLKDKELLAWLARWRKIKIQLTK